MLPDPGFLLTCPDLLSTAAHPRIDVAVTVLVR